jgi:thioredoxin reductase
MHDVIIIGGSYAGLAAAMQLGRARRTALVFDHGQPRNRFSHAAHGFLGFDGEHPDAIRERGRRQVAAYSTISFANARVLAVTGEQDHFRVVTDAGEHEARRIILASGVVDELPAIPGIAERWGQCVFHCPYCDGYERDLGRLGVIASTPHAAMHAILVSQWAGQTHVFLAPGFELAADDRAQLVARGITLHPHPVREVTGTLGAVAVRLTGQASPIEVDALFVAAQSVVATELAAQLGLELDAGPAGAFYKTGVTKETNVPGVFACGDVSLPAGTVAFAVADGTRAGIAAHQSLVFR